MIFKQFKIHIINIPQYWYSHSIIEAFSIYVRTYMYIDMNLYRNIKHSFFTYLRLKVLLHQTHNKIRNL